MRNVQVPLQGLVENTSEPHRSDQQSTVVLHTIEEESHNCGIGDIVMITAPTALYPGAHQDMLNWSGTVVKVRSAGFVGIRSGPTVVQSCF